MAKDLAITELKQKIEDDILDENARKSILKLFANVIEKNYDINPSNWNVSYRTGGSGLRFQLNVGHTYILGLYKDCIIVMCEKESFSSLSKDFQNKLSSESSETEIIEKDGILKICGEKCIQVKIPFSKCEEYLETLEPAICDFAKWCTENRKLNPESEEAHVSAFIDYLNQELKISIPQPEYEGENKENKWVISCNPDIYDAISAFKELKSVDWKQSEKNHFKVNDVVYIYISTRNQGIRIKTKIEKLNLTKDEIKNDTKFILDEQNLGTSSKYMRLQLIENLTGTAFDIEKLKLFDFVSPQGPMRIKDSTYNYLSFIEYLQKHTEINPYTYDASYELVTEVIKSYSRMEDFSKCDFNDLDLIYLSTVGTWKHSVEKKIDSVNKSNLPQTEKKLLIEYISNLWERVNSREFTHCENESKITFGMFGTGFYTTKTKTDSFNVQKFIQMCVNLLPIEEDEVAFELVEENIASGFKGLATAGISVILHCLKPFIFPILNSNQGKNNIFEKLGLNLSKINSETTYIENSRKIKAYRDSNFNWKNYRIFDRENFENTQGDTQMEEPENIMNSNKRIWKVSHGIPDFTEKEITECLNGSYVRVHSYTKAKGTSSLSQGENFIENVNTGDLFYLCRGNQKILLIGKFTSDPIKIDEDGWVFRKYEKLYTPIKNGSYNGPSRWWTPNNNSTFIEIKKNDYPDFESLILKPFFGIDLQTLNLINGEKNMEKINEYASLLENTKNLILTGAPGTGKTYLAKQIAKELGCEDDNIGFVQFHPSYDYTDFVEGLRPTDKDGNGNVGFERRDGVFKAFCEKALKESYRENSDNVDNFEECWKKLVDELNENNYIDISLLSGKGNLRVELNEYGTGLANRTYENDDYQEGNWISGKSKFFSKDQLYNIYQGLPGVPAGGHDNYRKAIVEYMKKNLGLLDYKKTESTQKTKKNFVFIIDEINRGEVAKIFGELFYCVDPGYRGEKGRISTQYQNLVTSGEFQKGFFIPENVYIIGTMNDIDRSVESMDFAFRRRFTWAEVKASDTVNMLYPSTTENGEQTGLESKELADESKRRMENLNSAISEIEGLNEAYHIGASYFLKLKNYNGNQDERFECLWEYHIKGILQEYLRGNPKAQEELEKLKAAYDREKEKKDGE